MPSPDRAISEETALSCTPTEKKKKASLCPQQDLSSSPLWPCSLSFALLCSLCLCLPPTHTHSHTHKHTLTITVACEEHGLGSGEVDCSPPQGFLRMKSGVMAVSTIRLMLMVYDPSGCPCTHPDTHTYTLTHHDEEILSQGLSTSNIFPETSQCAATRRFIKMYPFKFSIPFTFYIFTHKMPTKFAT